MYLIRKLTTFSENFGIGILEQAWNFKNRRSTPQSQILCVQMKSNIGSQNVQPIIVRDQFVDEQK